MLHLCCGTRFCAYCVFYLINGVIGHIRPQCHKLKREQNHVARSIPKKPSGPKHIVCHHCGAFGHLRPHCSMFHALKRIKRKEKLELLGSCAKKGKLDLSENSMLLKKVFNALNSLSVCIFGPHSSNPRLSSHKTLIPNNYSIWMRKGSYGWAFAFLVLDLILPIFVGPFMHSLSYLHAFCASCISIICIVFYFIFFILLLYFSFVWVKIQNHIKSEKFKKFNHICFSTYHIHVLPCTFVQMVLCI